MKRYGCVGKKLPHSFSKEIHARLADYPYELIELTEKDLPSFFTEKAFAAVNVTIPYKQTVMAYLDEISEIASRIGAVNTVVNRGGRLYGYNTDYHGMKALLCRVGLSLAGKKVLILGTGGTGKTARAVAEDLGASAVLTVSRKAADGVVTYDEAKREHGDAQIIINTTPVGMFPDASSSPIELDPFYRLEGVIDAVYNPLRTRLVSDALTRGLRAQGGLFMLVMQAVFAAEKFLDKEFSPTVAQSVFDFVLAEKENLVLVGMPGCGKSTVGRLLEKEGYAFVDTDAAVEARVGCSIRRLIEEKGEEYFRDVETEVIRELSLKNGIVLATGGGAVLREENVRALKQNGRLFFLEAALDRLCATDDRPLSDTEDKLKKLYEERMPIYRRVADVTVPDGPTAEDAAAYILKQRKEARR